MIGLLWNVLLALAWAAVTGDFSEDNLVIGFVLGFVILFFSRRVVSTGYVVRAVRAVDLLVYFVWELFLANLRVAYDVITPAHRARPAVLAIPLEVKTEAEITMLANLITLTPGTLSLDVSADRSTLYIHAMYIEGRDFDSFRMRIKQGFERRVLRLMR